MKPFKNRVLDPNQPVFVYRNLHKKCFSVRQGSKVVAHANELDLRDCTLIVRESGSIHCKQTGQRTVHAFIHGMIASQPNYSALSTEITYRPLLTTVL